MSDEQEQIGRAIAPDLRLWGRRRGKKLRDRQQDLMDTVLPRLSVPVDGPIDMPALFGRVPDKVWLEIGFGGGEHLAAQARAHPGYGLIGCEPFENGVAKLLADLDDDPVDNIRLHCGDVRDVLTQLGDGSVDRAFLLFPDPWPKTRHHKRRFVSPANLDLLARVIPPGGTFRIATDIAHYARWSLARIFAHGAFEWDATCAQDWRVRPDDWPPTRYEFKAIKAGRRPVYLSFRRVQSSP